MRIALLILIPFLLIGCATSKRPEVVSKLEAVSLPDETISDLANSPEYYTRMSAPQPIRSFQNKSEVQSVIAPSVASIHLSWKNNYDRENEITIVKASSDVLLPVALWWDAAYTTNGYASFPETESKCFFRVVNWDIDTGEQN